MIMRENTPTQSAQLRWFDVDGVTVSTFAKDLSACSVKGDYRLVRVEADGTLDTSGRRQGATCWTRRRRHGSRISILNPE